MAAPLSFVEVRRASDTSRVSLQQLDRFSPDGHVGVLRDLTSTVTPAQLGALGLPQKILAYKNLDTGDERAGAMEASAVSGRAAAYIIRAHDPEGEQSPLPVGVASFAYPQVPRPSLRVPGEADTFLGRLQERAHEWSGYTQAKSREVFMPATKRERILSLWMNRPILEEGGFDPITFARAAFREALAAADESHIPELLVIGRGTYEATAGDLVVVEHQVDNRLLRDTGFRQRMPVDIEIEKMGFEGELWSRTSPVGASTAPASA